MRPDLVVSGVGVISAIGQGKSAFVDALMNGHTAFDVLRRAGRQGPETFIGAEIAGDINPDGISAQIIRAASLSARAALFVLQEAWYEARLSLVDPLRIGVIVGGCNFQQREQAQLHDRFRDRRQFLTPAYALSFMDSDVCGFCTEHFGIRGMAYTVGGASASGQLAVIQAAQAVLTKQVDVCIAIGALMDLSYWECQGFRSVGAMGSDRYANQPQYASRPFDRNRDGFIYGESSGAVVIESIESSQLRGILPYAVLRGWSMAIDGNRSSDPSLEGEVRAIKAALDSANYSASEIDYINPHGTGSSVGDETELAAIRAAGLEQAYINTTKSLVGHGLSAAGTVEVIATLLQMRAGRLHPSKNLDEPIDPTFNWVKEKPIGHSVRNALTLSMGFGGVNTALCWQSPR